MNQQENNLSKFTDHLFRHEAGKMVAVLTRVFGLHNIEMAEDVVQDTFVQALKDWTYKVPVNPAAWLMLTAKNKAIDVVRRERYKKKFAEETTVLLQSEYTASSVIENMFLPHEIRDSQLRMIFACCHPSLSEPDQLALTLKTCSGFSVDEIASALLSNKETIKKRLQRAKQFISDNNLKFDIPVGAELNNRLDIVLQAIYLLFNEGYNSNSKDLIRKDLCEEALRLALMLTEHTYTNKPKCAALVSLFALQVSRFDARESELGEIILLENQDRDKWNQQLIKIGLDYLRKSSEGSELSEYHIEAAIAAQHASAKSFLETNWENILNLYDLLIQVNHSPVVLLNRAIVLSKVTSVKDSIKEIENIPGVDKLLQSNYLFCSVLGELYRLDNKSEKANQFFLKAISLTNSESEKKLLQRKISMIKD